MLPVFSNTTSNSALGYRGYGAELPAGHYQVRAGLLGPVGGFQQVYEIDSVSIDSDLRWDITLADAATAVAEEAAVKPQGFALAPNYSNPFNPTTEVGGSRQPDGEKVLRYGMREKAGTALNQRRDSGLRCGVFCRADPGTGFASSGDAELRYARPTRKEE